MTQTTATASAMLVLGFLTAMSAFLVLVFVEPKGSGTTREADGRWSDGRRRAEGSRPWHRPSQVAPSVCYGASAACVNPAGMLVDSV